MGKPSADDRYSEQEAESRTEAALRAAFGTPHKTYAESKLGKRSPRRKASPGKRQPVQKSGG
jgi:hypothetical protein